MNLPGSTVPPSTVKSAKQLPDATPGRAVLPPHPPISSRVAPQVLQAQQQQQGHYLADEDSENIAPAGPDRTSSVSSSDNTSGRESEGTQYTSLTLIKERPLSTDSHTVVRVNQA